VPAAVARADLGENTFFDEDRGQRILFASYDLRGPRRLSSLQ